MQCLFGGIAKLVVARHLKGGEVEESGRCLCAFLLLYIGDSEWFVGYSLDNGLAFFLVEELNGSVDGSLGLEGLSLFGGCLCLSFGFCLCFLIMGYSTELHISIHSIEYPAVFGDEVFYLLLSLDDKG